jgi:hypothetical protein
MNACCSAGTSRQDYLFSATRYTLEAQPRPDPRGTCLEGSIVVRASRKRTNFRLWREAGRQPALPLRIEYQPRPFLRLAFERVV